MLGLSHRQARQRKPAGRRENGRQRRVWPEFCVFCRDANNHQRAHSWQHVCWRHEHGVGAKRATSQHAVRDSRNSYLTPSVCSERVAATLLYIVVTMVGLPQRPYCNIWMELHWLNRVHKLLRGASAAGDAGNGSAAVNAAAAASTRTVRRPVQRQSGSRRYRSGSGRHGGGASDGRGGTGGGQRLGWWACGPFLGLASPWRCGGGRDRPIQPPSRDFLVERAQCGRERCEAVAASCAPSEPKPPKRYCAGCKHERVEHSGWYDGE